MSLTNSQREAIAAEGNIIVAAGAGTGKTRTLVERCVRLIRTGCPLDQILMVTFTEAAAAEMRRRIRTALEHELASDPSQHLSEQLAWVETAAISTLHSFCLQLVRQHFYELHLDPELVVFDSQQTRPMIRETLDELLQQYYADPTEPSAAVREFIRRRGRGSDFRIRQWIVRLHEFSQTLPDPIAWLQEQTARFSEPEPVRWRIEWRQAILQWRKQWFDALEPLASQCKNLAECHAALRVLNETATEPELNAVLEAVNAADNSPWPYGLKTRLRSTVKRFFAEAEFLRSLCSTDRSDPLREDWEWVRADMLQLLRVTSEFTAKYAQLKRERGGLDFADLEQLALRLLRDPETGEATRLARDWQQRLRYIFVDEYQDINAAQDAILTALSRTGAESNRFLVGDVKQSIYRFRLANPKIFQQYVDSWANEPHARVIYLNENFRSGKGILDFVNAFFSGVMRRAMGGLSYGPEARLTVGRLTEPPCPSTIPADSPPDPRVALHLILRDRSESTPGYASPDEPEKEEELAPNDFTGGSELMDLLAAEKESRLIARLLSELKGMGHLICDPETGQVRPVDWRDMVVLLRSPVSRVESYAKEFSRENVPLAASRGGFFQSTEISDLLSLLRTLDNPLQDIPLLAVLRSPLVGLSLDELAEIRTACPDDLYWTSVMRFRETDTRNLTNGSRRTTHALVDEFCRRFERWRNLSRVTSLSYCLETVLADTHYEALLRAEPHGAARAANVRRLLDLVRQYDPYRRQGLFRFLKFVEAQQDEEIDLESTAAETENAVRLTSIHQSKGLEFPVVVLADLGKVFNFVSLHDELIVHEQFGLCPQVVPPGRDSRYPSLPHWLAQRRERSELMGEEMRLLYVAMTRARDTLILTGQGDSKNFGPNPERKELTDTQLLNARSFLDWLKCWLANAFPGVNWAETTVGANDLLRWQFYTTDDPRLHHATRSPNQTRPGPPPSGESNPLESSARSAPTASDQSRAVQEPFDFEQIQAKLTWRYPHHTATLEPAKANVSALRKRVWQAQNEDASQARFVRSKRLRSAADAESDLTGADVGIAHHLLLQWAPVHALCDSAELEREADRLLREGHLTEAQRQAIDIAGLVQFWQGDLGQKIRQHELYVHRELPFTARFTLEELTTLDLLNPAREGAKRNVKPSISSSRHSDGNEFVAVQGVVDLAVIRPGETWLLDFKTDRVTEQNWKERASEYGPQLKLYAMALERIYRQPVTACWLHFLAIQRSILSD